MQHKEVTMDTITTSIRSDWLLIYKLTDGIMVLTLVRTGTHSDLFDE